VLLGYLFAQSLDLVERYLRFSGGIVVGLVVLALVLHRVRAHRRHRREDAEATVS
jgi:membrane protein DedA with SNARE-associated domain